MGDLLGGICWCHRRRCACSWQTRCPLEVAPEEVNRETGQGDAAARGTVSWVAVKQGEHNHQSDTRTEQRGHRMDGYSSAYRSTHPSILTADHEQTQGRQREEQHLHRHDVVEDLLEGAGDGNDRGESTLQHNGDNRGTGP